MKQTENSVKIRHAEMKDKDFWFSLDKHLPVSEYEKKIRYKQCYVLFVNDCAAGILRYNLFWDNTPFCTMLYISKDYQNSGYGKKLTARWENDMLRNGYGYVIVSTQEDENAQHFYRALGYRDCGSMSLPNQAKELFLIKNLA
ncbi:MAG: GNAT family N-acetyltransferase [Corallococcus sp.]|nr:GNAT family N-acetyltransferase [Corallococcus sp.]MCM1359810.1 GNAT family N-acetyltransferase [Corallococcus sp.]MCM1395244.1 GNAT family N-acetyltransferase [Corallococcus sp.]